MNALAAADVVAMLEPRLRTMGVPVEIDFSWQKDAIVAHDMRRPASIRVGTIYDRRDLENGVYMLKGNFERRVRSFLEGA